MDLSEIKKLKRNGDNITVGTMLGITSDVARMTLNRPGSKRHKDVLAAYEIVIKMRECIIS